MKSKISERIAARRDAMGLSRKDLARLLNTSEAQIWRYEKGENDPTVAVLMRLAQALSTNASWLLGETEEVIVVSPTKKKFVINTPLLKVYHRIHSIDALEQDVIEELRKKTPEARKKALEIIRLL